LRRAFLGESNRQQTEDNEQVGREADALMGIEKEWAKRRQAEQAQQNQPQAKKTTGEKNLIVKPVTQSEKQTRTPPSRDAVGKKVGVSGLTAERSALGRPGYGRPKADREDGGARCDPARQRDGTSHRVRKAYSL
jgi:hypothetical protein